MRRRLYNPGSKRTFSSACAVLGVIGSLAFARASFAQNAPPPTPANKAALALLRAMAGTWTVQQRMWPGFGEKPVTLPPAIARRSLSEGLFLEETMELAPSSSEKSFKRNATINFNPVSQQYEYFSLDTRAPQMMQEKSRPVRSQKKEPNIRLYGGRFVAAQWGKATNVAFTYRLTLGTIANDRQIVQLYLMPQTGKNAREFLAFEYRYTRQR